MNLDEFLVLVCPPFILAAAIVTLIFWGSIGNTNEKPDKQ